MVKLVQKNVIVGLPLTLGRCLHELLSKNEIILAVPTTFCSQLSRWSQRTL